MPPSRPKPPQGPFPGSGKPLPHPAEADRPANGRKNRLPRHCRPLRHAADAAPADLEPPSPFAGGAQCRRGRSAAVGASGAGRRDVLRRDADVDQIKEGGRFPLMAPPQPPGCAQAAHLQMEYLDGHRLAV